jgi:GMP synthase-like glutamine amidotransferase
MILIVDMNYKKDSLSFYEFVLPIVSIAEELDECIVKHYSEVGREDLSKFDSVILSGTALKDHATLSQPEKFEWIRDCGNPVLGICAGMQTIGLVFGLHLKKCLGIGMAQIRPLKANPMFSSTFKAYTLHNYSVTSSPEFDVLAESENCVQAIKHKRTETYGVLFHPEVRNRDIIQRFVLRFRATEEYNTHKNKN